MSGKKFDLLVGRTHYLKGVIQAPASKSYTTRAIIIGSLGKRARIINPLICDDTLAAIKTWQRLGAVVKKEEGELEVKGLNGKIILKSNSINVGESGTLLRLMLPILALGKGRYTVDGKGTLLKRPNRPMAEALRSLGVGIEGRDEDFRLPITIEARGEITGGKVKVSGRISSQTISSLLNVAPFANEDITIIVEDKLVSWPYIDITIDVLKTAGIRVKEQGSRKFFVASGQKFKPKAEFFIHGDYSSAAFLMAACCLVKSDVTITDLVKDKQGDREIINILHKMGAGISYRDNSVRIKGPFDLRGIDINCRNTPDLVPVLCVLGCFAKGVTRIFDIGHLAYKESNRITSPTKELKKMGADIEMCSNGLIIKQSVLRPACVRSYADHRIAMALAVSGLRVGEVRIQDASCISKSYPDFILDFNSLGAMIKKI